MPLHNSLLTSPEASEAPQVTEEGMELEEPKEATQEPAVPAEPEPEPPSEFEKLFKACEESPEDFNGWVYLLQYVEQEVSEDMLIFSLCILQKLTRSTIVLPGKY